MKRITDHFNDPVDALNNGCFSSYLTEVNTKASALGRSNMVLGSIQMRETLDITDIASHIEHEISDMTISDIEGGVPPWPFTLIEWEPDPGSVVASMAAKSTNFRVKRVGVIFLRLSANQFCNLMGTLPADTEVPIENMIEELSKHDLSAEERRDIFIENVEITHVFTDEAIQSIGWYIFAYPFVLGPLGIFGPATETHILLDVNGKPITFRGRKEFHNYGVDIAHGTVVDADEFSGISIWNDWGFISQEWKQRLKFLPQQEQMRSVNVWQTQFAMSLIIPSLYAFHLANFINISPMMMDPTREHRPRQVQRHLERTNDVPTTKYHILSLGPVSGRKGNRKPLAESIASIPLHGVRGCHHHYGPEYNRGLLFGKYAGKFWVDAHVRGSADHGIVRKDYAEGEKRLNSVKELTRGNK
jgi:hypothetical protein